MEPSKYRFRTALTLGIDLAAIFLSYFCANYLRFGDIFETGISVSESTPVLYITLIYILIYFLQASERVNLTRSAWGELVSVLKNDFVLMVLLLLGFYVIKKADDLSRLNFGFLAIFIALYMFLFRMIYKVYLIQIYKKGSASNKIIIFTLRNMAVDIKNNLKKQHLWAYQIKGFILIDEPDSSIGTELDGIPIIGNHHNMFQCLTKEVVDEILIHVPYADGTHVAGVIEKFEDMGITVNLNIQIYDLDLRHRQKELRSLGGYYVITFRQTVITLQMAVFKRCMDIIGSIIGLLITGIAVIFVAPPLLIESPGSLFFSQIRIGRNGRQFRIYKFRSMYTDAEARKKELMDKNEMTGLMFKMKDDPRITKVGKFLRKTSIDELPQFWNVLKGEMSLVGTRPPTLDEFHQYESKYKRRLSIRPGITGLWQVSGRSEIKDFEEVLAMDLEYIDNWSVGQDIKLLFKTIFVVIFRRGAS